MPCRSSSFRNVTINVSVQKLPETQNKQVFKMVKYKIDLVDFIVTLNKLKKYQYLYSMTRHKSIVTVTLIFIKIESHWESDIGGDDVGGAPLKSKVVHISPVSFLL